MTGVEKECQMSLTIAIYQGCAKLGDKVSNVSKMRELMLEAKGKGADILVLPELFSTGYLLPNDVMKQLAEDQGGFTFTELSRQAKNIGIAVLYGYPELGGDGKFYNSAQFIDREGTSLANYHKTHLWIDDTKTEAVFTPGEAIVAFDYCGFKIGLLICYDVEFSEMVRLLALRGVEIVLAPVAVAKTASSGLHQLTDYLIPGHAVENRVHIVYVNFCGDCFWGNSKVFDSSGSKLINLGEEDEGIFTAVILKNKKCANHLTDRRPELYRKQDVHKS